MEYSPRPSRNETLMEMAYLMANRSTCNRLKVGAVFGFNGRLLASGYNGAPSGMPHCTPEGCNADTPCSNTQHAEANGIAFAAKYGIRLEGSSLYTTDSPCRSCAMLLINCGVTTVFYARPYRDEAGVELLKSGKIACRAFDPHLKF